MLGTWRAIALLFGQALCLVSSHVVLKEIVNRSVFIMECLSDTDITFHFKNKYSNGENRMKIAECETSLQACYLVNQLLGELYAVSFIGHGGMLIIIKDNNTTRGQYSCCETYKNSSCESMETGYLHKSSIQVNSDRTIHGQSNEEKPSLEIKEYKNEVDTIIPIMAIVAAIVAIVALVSIVAMKKGHCHRLGIKRRSLAYASINIQDKPTSTQPEDQTSNVFATSPKIVTASMTYDTARSIFTQPAEEVCPLVDNTFKEATGSDPVGSICTQPENDEWITMIDKTTEFQDTDTTTDECKF